MPRQPKPNDAEPKHRPLRDVMRTQMLRYQERALAEQDEYATAACNAAIRHLDRAVLKESRAHAKSSLDEIDRKLAALGEPNDFDDDLRGVP